MMREFLTGNTLSVLVLQSGAGWGCGWGLVYFRHGMHGVATVSGSEFW